VQILRHFMLVLGQAAQHPVYEARRAVRAKGLGQFHGLIDRHLDRRALLPGEFPGRDPQDVPVNRCDLVKRPFGCIPGKYGIQLLP